MNSIVKPNYPVERLPDDLRGDLSAGTKVTVVVHVHTNEGPLSRFVGRFSQKGIEGKQAVERIRSLRDEWGD